MSLISAISLIPFQSWIANEQHDVPEEVSPDDSQGQYFCVDVANEDDWGSAFAQYARENCGIQEVSPEQLAAASPIFAQSAINYVESQGGWVNYPYSPTSANLDASGGFLYSIAALFDKIDFLDLFDFSGMARSWLGNRSNQTCSDGRVQLYFEPAQICCLLDESCDTQEQIESVVEEHDAGPDGDVEEDVAVVPDAQVTEASPVDNEIREINMLRQSLERMVQHSRVLEQQLRAYNDRVLNSSAEALEEKRLAAQQLVNNSQASADEIRSGIARLRGSLNRARSAKQRYESEW